MQADEIYERVFQLESFYALFILVYCQLKEGIKGKQVKGCMHCLFEQKKQKKNKKKKTKFSLGKKLLYLNIWSKKVK